MKILIIALASIGFSATSFAAEGDFNCSYRLGFVNNHAYDVNIRSEFPLALNEKKVFTLTGKHTAAEYRLTVTRTDTAEGVSLRARLEHLERGEYLVDLGLDGY